MLSPLPKGQRAQGKLFVFKTMERLLFDKPPLSYYDQIQLLRCRFILISYNRKNRNFFYIYPAI